MPNIFSNLFRSTKKSFSSKDDPAFQAYTQFLGLGNPVYTPKDYAVLAKEGFEKNVTVYKGVSLIAQSCAGIPWKLYQRRSKLTEIDSHPLLDLLANPNARYSQGEFIEQMVSFWILSGNTYVTTVRPNVRALPSELWVMRPDRMRVVPGISTIAGYEYYVDGLRSYFVASDILHLKMFAATNDWYGLSPVMVAASLVDQQNEGFDWNTALIQNSGRPSGALVANGTLSSDQYERLRRVIRERYVGKKNAGMPMLLEGGIDWKPFSLSPLELDWKESRTLNMRDISIALGVPPELMGDSSNKTYSNYGEARKSFYQETVLPLMDKLRDRLNVWLVSQYGDDLYLNYDKEEIEALQEDRDSLSGRMLAQWEAGVVTLNEAREALGLDEIPGGDVLQLNASTYIYIPTASLTDVIEQKLENLLAPPPPPPAAIAAPTSVPDPTDPKTDTAAESASSGPEKDATGPVPAKVGKQPLPLKKPTPLPSPKQPQAKSWEGSTEIKATKDPQVLALETKLQAYFAAEKKRVVFSAKRAALPTTVGLRFDFILNKHQGPLTDLLLAANRPLMYESGQAVLQRLSEAKQAVPFLEPALKKQANASAARIQETTRLALVEAMDYGIAKNETVDELAARIEAVYDGDMQGWRARQIAQTEVTRTTNYGMYAAAYSLGLPVQKTWVTVGDERVRPSHQEVAGMVLNLDESFGVAGENMLYPGDLESGATASNVINCRCSIDYLLAGKAGGVPEEKDNPNHAENGQFDFGSGGAGGGTGATPKPATDTQKPNPFYAIAVGMDVRSAGSERDDVMQSAYSTWAHTLPAGEKQAIQRYAGTEYERMNKVLRNGSVAGSGQEQDILAATSALNKAVAPFDFEARRGTYQFDGDEAVFASMQKNVGKTFTDPAFSSTTTDPYTVFGNKGGIEYVIKVPQGAHGGYIDAIAQRDEHEFLLPPNTKFLVKSVEIIPDKRGLTAGKRTVTLEVQK